MGNSNSTTWKDPYEEKLKNYLQQIENREPFSFDVNKDAMYQQLRENYERQGKLAMEDTMGQAAAMTGGYGNSYAQTVGQQVYMQNMKDLNEMVPTIQSMAQDRYDQETNDLYTKYSLYKGLSDESYNKYIDETYNKYIQEQSATSGGSNGSGAVAKEYDPITYEDDAKWTKKLENNHTWDGIVGVWGAMERANHDPVKAANMIIEFAKVNNIRTTVASINDFGDKLEAAGVPGDVVGKLVDDWLYKFGFVHSTTFNVPNSPTKNTNRGGTMN